MDSSLAVIIAAAGTGSRMEAGINKQFLLIDGKPMLAHTLDVFEKTDLVNEIVIVAHQDEIEYCTKEIVECFNYQKVAHVIPGGETRQDSVWEGLQRLSEQTNYVAVHDGARPFASSTLLKNLLTEAIQWGAAIPGIQSRDTLKMIDRDFFVSQTLDRSIIWAIQTPQVFNYQELKSAYESALQDGLQATDDATLFETYIGRVKIVAGENDNFKITTPDDLIRADYLAKQLKSLRR